MNAKMHTAYLSFGTNLGDRAQNLETAIELIKHVGEIVKKSSIYMTEAWGNSDQPAFYNMVLCLETRLDPVTLLHELLSFETKMGRVRHDKWGPRLIDMDILLFDDMVVHHAGLLTVPHPEMQNRRFVLMPLTEIAPTVMHPTLGKNIRELLAHLQDPLEVKRIDE